MKKTNRILVFTAVGILLFSYGNAAITDSTSNGFTVKHEITIKGSPDNAYRQFVDHIGNWWSSEHTYSGNAANLSISAQAGGCFCEKLPNGGSVQHMTVVYANPGIAIRMLGGLGPLQSMAVTGSMTVNFSQVQDSTKVMVNYTVGGYVNGGILKLAPIVDKVIGEQVTRFRNYCN
jgi:hypothetical protein